jgi:hypothetical protein
VAIRRRIADFIAKIGKKKIECGSAFRTKKATSMFHGKTGKHLCRICTETIDILSINVKRKHVFYLYIVITML